jgi:hypothetical protein
MLACASHHARQGPDTNSSAKGKDKSLAKSRKERASELQKIRVYLRNAEQEINALKIVPRVARKFPFDIVGLATLSKSFALAKACLKLLASGHPDEAYGLSRSLVECATNLRYLTSDFSELDKRTHDFVNFALADKAFWYHHALEAAKTPKVKAELRSYAEQMKITDNAKLARQHWSGLGAFVWTVTLSDHPLDGSSTVDFRKKAHAVDYYQTSSFVHCSLPAIDNYFTDDGVEFRISNASTHRDKFQSTLFVILVYIHHAIAYVLYALNVDGYGRFQTLFQRTLKKMMAVQARHRLQGN